MFSGTPDNLYEESDVSYTGRYMREYIDNRVVKK